MIKIFMILFVRVEIVLYVEHHDIDVVEFLKNDVTLMVLMDVDYV